MKKRKLLLLLLSLLLIGQLACQKNNSTVKPLKIGALLTTSGPYAGFGIPYAVFYRAYIDYIKAHPDKYPYLKGQELQAVFYDDGGDSALGTVLLNKLLSEDEVAAIVGVFGNWNIIANQKLLEESLVPVVCFALASSAPAYQELGFGYKNVVTWQPLWESEGAILYLRAVTAFGDKINKISVIYTNNEESQSLLKGLKTQAEQDVRSKKAELVYINIDPEDNTEEIKSRLTDLPNNQLIIIAAGQNLLTKVYPLIQENPLSQGLPILTTYANMSVNVIPKEAYKEKASPLYGGAWWVYAANNNEKTENSHNLLDYQDFCAIIDWTDSINIQDKETFKTDNNAISAYIAISTFLVGLERLKEENLEYNLENYLLVMQEKQLAIAISGNANSNLNSKNNQMALALFAFEPGEERNQKSATFKMIEDFSTAAELFAKLK